MKFSFRILFYFSSQIQFFSILTHGILGVTFTFVFSITESIQRSAPPAGNDKNVPLSPKKDFQSYNGQFCHIPRLTTDSVFTG